MLVSFRYGYEWSTTASSGRPQGGALHDRDRFLARAA